MAQLIHDTLLLALVVSAAGPVIGLGIALVLPHLKRKAHEHV